MQSEITSDEALVERCKEELPYETKSFGRLVHRYKGKVFHKSLAILRNREEARDVSQDIFVKVFHALPGFREEASFSTWLYSITVNTCLNHKEKLQRRPWWWLGEDIDELERSARLEQDLLYLMGDALERQEMSDRIQRVMNLLTPQSQEVLKLRFHDELDYREVAKRLRIGLSATKMRLKRARDEFKKNYEECSGEHYNA